MEAKRIQEALETSHRLTQEAARIRDILRTTETALVSKFVLPHLQGLAEVLGFTVRAENGMVRFFHPHGPEVQYADYIDSGVADDIGDVVMRTIGVGDLFASLGPLTLEPAPEPDEPIDPTREARDRLKAELAVVSEIDGLFYRRGRSLLFDTLDRMRDDTIVWAVYKAHGEDIPRINTALSLRREEKYNWTLRDNEHLSVLFFEQYESDRRAKCVCYDRDSEDGETRLYHAPLAEPIEPVQRMEDHA